MLCPHMILGGRENQERVQVGRVVDLPLRPCQPCQCLDGVHLRIHGFGALFSSQVRCNCVRHICNLCPPPSSPLSGSSNYPGMQLLAVNQNNAKTELNLPQYNYSCSGLVIAMYKYIIHTQIRNTFQPSVCME